MTPLGKEINPNIKDTEHEGLKRVYKPTTEKIKRKMKQSGVKPAPIQNTDGVVNNESNVDLKPDIETTYFEPINPTTPIKLDNADDVQDGPIDKKPQLPKSL